MARSRRNAARTFNAVAGLGPPRRQKLSVAETFRYVAEGSPAPTVEKVLYSVTQLLVLTDGRVHSRILGAAESDRWLRNQYLARFARSEIQVPL